MILWAFKPHTTETVPAWNTAPLRSWRWAIEAEVLFVGLSEQVRFGERADWSGAVRYFWAGVSRRVSSWHVGMHHDYYDGPHHALWIGPIYLNWSLGWCDVCMPPGDDEEDAFDLGSMLGDMFTAAMNRAPGGAA